MRSENETSDLCFGSFSAEITLVILSFSAKLFALEIYCLLADEKIEFCSSFSVEEIV